MEHRVSTSTPENFGIKVGDKAMVKRSDGTIEGDWQVLGVIQDHTSGEPTVLVHKYGANSAEDMRKFIPVTEFKKLNGSS